MNGPFMIQRKFDLDIKTIDREARTVEGASLSSNSPINHIIDGITTPVELVHRAEAVDLPESIPLLWQHDMHQPIGKIDRLTIEDGTLRGRFNFSRNSKAQDVFRDIEDGFLSDTSVKAMPVEWDDDEDSGGIIVTRWDLIEGSIVTIGADNSVGLDRSKTHEGENMSDDTNTGTDADQGGTGTDTDNVISFQRARESGHTAGVSDGVKIERQRVNDIERLFDGPAYQGDVFQDLKRSLVDNGTSIELAREQLLTLVGQGTEPAAAGNFAQVRDKTDGPTTDQEKFATGMERALQVRLSLTKDKDIIREVRANELGNMTMTELAREYCRRNQLPVSGLNREQIVGMAMSHGAADLSRGVMGHSTSSFSSILENISTKALLVGWDLANENWQTWCRTGNLPDFKQASRTGLSSFSDLDLIYENGEYKEGTRSDVKENIQLLTYGKLMSISRQALANDDLGALSTTPQAMGMKANRKIGDLAYALLSGVGPTLNQDSTALFDAAGHSNYLASGSGAAPSVATVNAARTAMATMTDPGGETMAMPSSWYLLVPWALHGTASVLMAAEFDPAEGGTTSFREPNSVRNMASVITDARLDADLATGWYLTADPNQADTVEVAFLNGQQTPYLEQQEGFVTDGIRYKVRIDCAVAALDFRRIYKNYGA